MDVTCAIIIKDGLVLLTQRPLNKKQGGKWEFPGGKVNTGEAEESCILREIHEELSLNLSIHKRLEPIRHKYQDFSIRLIPFLCTIKNGNLNLNEHISLKWVKPQEIKHQDLCEADVKLLPQLIASL